MTPRVFFIERSPTRDLRPREVHSRSRTAVKSSSSRALTVSGPVPTCGAYRACFLGRFPNPAGGASYRAPLFQGRRRTSARSQA